MYRTVVRNNQNNAIRLRSPANYVGTHFAVPPKKLVTLEYEEEKYMLAPYSEVCYRKNGDVKTTKRKDYRPQELKFPFVTFLNEGGNFTEVLILDEVSKVELPRGIERTIEVSPFSVYSESTAVTIKEPLQVPVPDPARGGIKFVTKPNIKYECRPKEEIERIKKMRLRAFLKSSGFPETLVE